MSKQNKLAYLNLSSNELEVLGLSNQTDLVELQAIKNKIVSIKHASSMAKLLCVFISNNQLPKEELNLFITALPDVNNVEIDEEDDGWKCRLNILNNPGAADADVAVAVKKGWRVNE